MGGVIFGGLSAEEVAYDTQNEENNICGSSIGRDDVPGRMRRSDGADGAGDGSYAGDGRTDDSADAGGDRAWQCRACNGRRCDDAVCDHGRKG